MVEDLIIQEAERTISIQENGEAIRISTIQAVIRSLSINAVKGKILSQRLFLQLKQIAEEEKYKREIDYFQAMGDYKYDWQEVIDDARKHGNPIPEPTPHPEHIMLNVHKGTARLLGPMTPDDKKEWDQLVALKLYSQAELKELQAELAATENEDMKEFIRREMEFPEEMVSKLTKIIPDDLYLPPSTLEYCKTFKPQDFHHREYDHQKIAEEIFVTQSDKSLD